MPAVGLWLFPTPAPLPHHTTHAWTCVVGYHYTREHGSTTPDPPHLPRGYYSTWIPLPALMDSLPHHHHLPFTRLPSRPPPTLHALPVTGGRLHHTPRLRGCYDLPDTPHGLVYRALRATPLWFDGSGLPHRLLPHAPPPPPDGLLLTCLPLHTTRTRCRLHYYLRTRLQPATIHTLHLHFTTLPHLHTYTGLLHTTYTTPVAFVVAVR